MKLFNYLRELSNYEDVGDTEIRLVGIENLLNKLFDDIKYIRSKDHTKYISNRLNVPTRTLNNWFSGSSPIPISTLFDLMNLWREKCNKSELELKNMFDLIFLRTSYFSIAKGRKVMLPKKINPKLAYLLGYAMGDGCLVDYLKKKISTGSFKYEIKIASTTEDFAKNILNPLFENVFGIKGKIYKTNRECFVLFIQSKVLYIFLNKIFGFPIGKKKGKLVVPELIKESDDEIKKNFIAGFFDADGHIYIKNKEIAFAQADRKFLEELSEILNDTGFLTRGIYKFEKELGTTFLLSLRWSSVKKFVEEIPVLYPDKIKKVNELRGMLSE